MKLKQRIWLCVLGLSVLLVLLVTIHTGTRTLGVYSPRADKGWRDNQARLLEHVDKFNMGRNLNMMATEAGLSGILSKIIDSISLRDSMKPDESKQALQVLLQNKNLTLAFIQMGHVLEQHIKQERALTKEELPHLGADPEEMGRLSDPHYTNTSYDLADDETAIDSDVTTELRDILKTMGYKHRKHKRPRIIRLPYYENTRLYADSPSFLRFYRQINKYELYSPDGAVVDTLLSDIASLPFASMTQKVGGTQLKLTFGLKDHSQTIFKPMRFPREQETLPNHFYFSDYERHNAEIAAFHLDRILGLRRVPPTAGRLVNITQDIWRYAEHTLEKTFFISPAGNVCFHGHCEYYCDTGHAICGHPELLEGSFVIHLPDTEAAQRTRWRHPWRRSYHKRKKAKWETDYRYCDDVRQTPPYTTGRRLLDLMDMSVFDFLTGNMDRHHYETFTDFDNDTFPILFDNGRSFGKASHDEMSILAPVFQCCLMRASTLSRLLALHSGPYRLSHLMKASLARDRLDPVLTDGHLTALDRRVATVLLVINECAHATAKQDHSDNVVDDGY